MEKPPSLEAIPDCNVLPNLPVAVVDGLNPIQQLSQVIDMRNQLPPTSQLPLSQVRFVLIVKNKFCNFHFILRVLYRQLLEHWMRRKRSTWASWLNRTAMPNQLSMGVTFSNSSRRHPINTAMLQQRHTRLKHTQTALACLRYHNSSTAIALFLSMLRLLLLLPRTRTVV